MAYKLINKANNSGRFPLSVDVIFSLDNLDFVNKADLIFVRLIEFLDLTIKFSFKIS
jgi:hypothetical protein